VTSVRWRLIVLLLVVVLLSVGVVGVVSTILTRARFEAYLGHRPMPGMQTMMRQMMEQPPAAPEKKEDMPGMRH